MAIGYAKMLFLSGKTDEALKQISAAESYLRESNLINTEVYADCIYSLGLYRFWLNDTSDGDEFVRAFRIYIDLYGKDSYFVQKRLNELRDYIENFHSSIIQNDRLLQLLEE